MSDVSLYQPVPKIGVYPLLAEPDLVNHLGFIFAEEEALKEHFVGIKVPARPGSSELQDVGVWYRFPEGERQIKYPFITIDLLSVDPAFDLFHSDHYWSTHDLYRPSFAPTLPEPPGGWATKNYAVWNYRPFRLSWQVSVFSRSALHDRYLTSIFFTDVLPTRPFWVHVKADDTLRRVERVGFVSANTPETTESGTKRIFRKIYTINMLAEIPQESLAYAEVYRVLRVLITGVNLDDFDRYYQEILGVPPEPNPDPINQFTHEERENAGEHFYVAHEGMQPPPAT